MTELTLTLKDFQMIRIRSRAEEGSVASSYNAPGWAGCTRGSRATAAFRWSGLRAGRAQRSLRDANQRRKVNLRTQEAGPRKS